MTKPTSTSLLAPALTANVAGTLYAFGAGSRYSSALSLLRASG